MVIKSADNKNIKEYKSLQSKKFRDESGTYIIEGEKLVGEAVAKKVEIVKLFVSSDYDAKNNKNSIYMGAQRVAEEHFVVENNLFTRMSDTKSPQGISAIVKKKTMDTAALAKGTLVIVMENVQDPGNMGTLIRTSSAVGASCLILCNACVDPYNPKVVRSAMGTLFNSSILELEDISEALDLLKANQFTVYAAHLKGEKNCFEVEYADKTAIILGNEAKGMTEKAASLADELIKIPMENDTESLNVSVAGSVLMYEFYRRKM